MFEGKDRRGVLNDAKVWTVISLTCPVAVAGRHYPISLYEVLAANAVTNSLVGLIVETQRHQLHHAK